MTIQETLSPALLAAAACELEKLAELTEAMGTRLCLDPAIAENHATTLQGIDHIAQSLSQLAKVVGAQSGGEAVDAVDAIGLQDLQDQLRTAGAIVRTHGAT